MEQPAQGTQSFLGDVFDQYQNMMQIARCVREAMKQLGMSQPRILELSRYPTNLIEYLPEAQITRYATHNDSEQPTLSIPVAVPFADKAFDVCFVTDAYEHISAEQRPGLLGEMLRTTHGLVLLGSPVRSEIVTRFDRVVFDFVWGKYAHEFEPAQQHVRYGLEPLDQIIRSLKAQGANRVVALPDNFIYRFLHQILIFFDLQYQNPHNQFYESINRIYNERVAPYDYREPCYRYLMVVATHPQINLDELEATMKGPCETPASLKQTEGVLVEAFRAADSRVADELRARLKEVSRLGEEIAHLRERLASREQEIDRLEHLQPLEKVIHFSKAVRARLRRSLRSTSGGAGGAKGAKGAKGEG
jgi:hypothetical protein